MRPYEAPIPHGTLSFMPKLIIGLVGRQGSGKGAAATILKEQYGAQLLRFSAALVDVLDRLAVPASRDNYITLSNLLRQGFGEDVLAYAIQRDILKSDADIVVVDGIRRIEDISGLEPLPQFKLIEVAAPGKVRYDRMRGRGEKSGESGMTWEQFSEQEQASTEITIPAVAARAWRAINNGGTAEELNQQIADLMAVLGTNPKT